MLFELLSQVRYCLRVVWDFILIATQLFNYRFSLPKIISNQSIVWYAMSSSVKRITESAMVAF